jgi:hypothetical protein
MPLPIIRRRVAKYPGIFRDRKYSCPDQFLGMVLIQITHRGSLREMLLTIRPGIIEMFIAPYSPPLEMPWQE